MKHAVKIFGIALLAMAMVVAVPPSAHAQGGVPASNGQVTHDQAAKMIFNLLGLYKGASGALSTQDIFDIMKTAKIVPSDKGWEAGKVMTIAEFARVMVGALKLHDKVKDPADPKAYIEVLKQEGVGVEDISGGLNKVSVPFSFFIGGIYDGLGASDPLKSRGIVGEPDEEGFSTDVSPSSFDPGAPVPARDFAAAIAFLEVAQTMARPRRTTPN